MPIPTTNRRHFDGDGLYLECTPAGGRHWRLKYRFAGKEKRLALGSHPDLKLAEARTLARQARNQLDQGIDPGAAKKALKASQSAAQADSFEVVAREWMAVKLQPTTSSEYHERVLARLEKDIFPAIGLKSIDAISAPEVLAALRKVEARGSNETAHRLCGHVGKVFRYGISTGRAQRDPTQGLTEALTGYVREHHAAILEPAQLAANHRVRIGLRGLVVGKNCLS